MLLLHGSSVAALDRNIIREKILQIAICLGVVDITGSDA